MSKVVEAYSRFKKAALWSVGAYTAIVEGYTADCEAHAITAEGYTTVVEACIAFARVSRATRQLLKISPRLSREWHHEWCGDPNRTHPSSR